VNWRGAIRRLIPYLIAIVGGFLVAYLIAAFVFFPSGVITQDLKVPNVIGLDYQTAQQRLAQSGFQADQGETRFHATAPKGTVLDQTPPAGSRDAAGAKVTLAVSGGQRMGTVPNVVGLSRPDAERALDQAGFDVGDVIEQPSQTARGEVVESRPGAGSQTPIPGPIQLVLSAGPSTIQVPDVVGRSFGQARQLLQQLGLAVGDVTSSNGGAPDAGALVMSQSPAAGAQVVAGSRIALRVGSEGRP
jgi:beta-lactam-binding protein with PASTA domain